MCWSLELICSKFQALSEVLLEALPEVLQEGGVRQVVVVVAAEAPVLVAILLLL